MRTCALLLVLGCGGATAAPSEPTEPTTIGASDELRAEDARGAEGPVGAALAAMPEADLTTAEGLEVLSFSAASALAMATFTLALGGHAEEDVNECFVVERSESDRGQRTSVRANDCPETQTPERRVSGEMVLEKRQSSCGEWTSLTFRPWTIVDGRPCGSSGSPKGTRTFEGRIVADECAGTMVLDLVLGGDGLQERNGECDPIRQTALRYRLGHDDDALEGGSPLSGRGEVGIAGVGRATVETIDEVIGRETCGTEAVSGLTRARSGGHLAEVSYDGASECTDPGSAPLALDGEPAGQVAYACAAAGSTTGAAALPLAFALLCLRRRRSAG